VRGDKGRRTRADLILAAREVFAEKGYFDARLSDITSRAGCATGTLYTYFRNREEVLGAVIDHATAELLEIDHGRRREPGGPADPLSRIRQGNRDYVEAYARNADLMHLMEQVAHIDPRIQQMRLDRAARFVERNSRSILRWQDRGLVDPALDARFTARALSAMVSRICYSIYVDSPDEEYAEPEGQVRLADQLTTIWANTLRLSPAAGEVPTGGARGEEVPAARGAVGAGSWENPSS